MVEKKVEEDNIYGIGFASLIANLVTCSFFGIASYKIFNIAKNDSYISAIIGIITSILPLIMIIYFHKKSEGKEIISLNVDLFGKFFGNLLNVIINIAYFCSAVILFYNITSFIELHYMPDTSIMYVQLVLLVVIIYAATKNINIIARISQLIFFINMIFFLICQTGIYDGFEVSRLYPMLENGISPVIKGSLIYFIFSAFPIFLVTIIPSYKIAYDKHNSRRITVLYFLVHLALFVIILTTLLTLGKELTLIYRYPEYHGLKTFSLFEIIERLENTLSLQFIFSTFVFMIMSFHFVIESICKLGKNKIVKNSLPYALGILLFVLCNLIFKNILEGSKVTLDIFPYIAGIGVLVPMIITTIGIFIRETKKCIKIQKSKKLSNVSNTN